MNDFVSNKNSPCDQLEYLKKVRADAKSKLQALEITTQKFITSFKTQEGELEKIHKKTSQEQATYKNLNTVKEQLDGVVKNLTTFQRLSPIIQSDLTVNNFRQYISAMEEIQRAQDALNSYQFEDARRQLYDIQLIKKRGIDELLKYFRKLITDINVTVPLNIMQFVDGEFKIVDERYVENELFPITNDVLEHLRITADHLRKLGNEDYIAAYTNSRKINVTSTINPLVKTSRERKKLATQFNVLDLPSYRRRVHPIHRYAFVLFLFFFRRERSLAQTIFGDSYAHIFEMIIDTQFSLFREAIIAVNQPVVAHTDILFDIDVLDTLTEIMQKTEFQPDKYLQMFMQLAHGFNANIESVLTAFLEGVGNHDLSDIPASGAVSALTSNSIMFLSKLARNNIMQVGRISVPKYVNDVLERLQKNLREKTAKFSDNVAAQLFVMNNAHFAYTTLSADTRLASLVSEEFLARLERDIQASQSAYMKLTWNVVFANLEYDKELKTYHKDQPLTQKQKDLVKQKFLAFTEGVIRLKDRHEKYALKNATLMEPIKKEAKNKVHTKFEPFYHRFTKVKFSDHPERYCKIVPSTVDDFIRAMYDSKRQVHTK